jgi:hypothetical protein
LLGPRFRLGLAASNSRLLDCVAFRVTCFPLDLDLRLDLCTSLHEGIGEGVKGYSTDVDELEAMLGAMVNEGARVWR